MLMADSLIFHQKIFNELQQKIIENTLNPIDTFNFFLHLCIKTLPI